MLVVVAVNQPGSEHAATHVTQSHIDPNYQVDLIVIVVLVPNLVLIPQNNAVCTKTDKKPINVFIYACSYSGSREKLAIYLDSETVLIVGVYVALGDVSGCVLGAWLMTVTTTSIMTLL